MERYSYIVVEDEDLIRKNIIKKIEQLGLPLKFLGEADNGQDALKLVDELFPDIVLTDIMMPIMDGLELAEEITFVYPRIKMVIITGHSDIGFAQKAIRFGVSDFLLKPIDPKSIFQTLQKIIIRLEAEDNKMDTKMSKDFAETELSKEEIVDIVEVFLQENYRNNITLSDVAKQMGFTVDYISRLFKKYRDESPVKFITKRRINDAKHLLIKYPDYEIRKVGEIVGYPDQYYFSRVFKIQTGLYPSEYRKSKLE